MTKTGTSRWLPHLDPAFLPRTPDSDMLATRSASPSCRPLAIGLAALMLVLIADESNAATLVDSEGFESPPFNQTSLEGQDGWVRGGIGASSAVIQDTVKLTGDQSLRVDRQASSDSFWAQRLSGVPGNRRFVTVDWDMRVDPSADPAGFGPFFGVSTFDDTQGPVLLSSSLGIDSTTGEVLIQATGSGVLTPVGLVTLGEWNHFRIELDFATDTYRAMVDDQVMISAGFIDGPSIDSLSDADIATLAAGPSSVSQSKQGVAYFDNFLVRDDLPGDYNADGLVNAVDYTVWRDSEGQSDSDLYADGNADGVIDEADDTIWRVNYGASEFISSSPSHAVPEPSTLLLLIAGSALACRPFRGTFK